jgi:hypothetical protein
MRLHDKPYFMSNPDWHEFDADAFCYKLTGKAPQKAIDSYNEFYKVLKNNKID